MNVYPHQREADRKFEEFQSILNSKTSLIQNLLRELINQNRDILCYECKTRELINKPHLTK